MNLETNLRISILSFAKNIVTKVIGKYIQKSLDCPKSGVTKVATDAKVAPDALKAASKISIQKIAKETGDLVGNKTADKKNSFH